MPVPRALPLRILSRFDDDALDGGLDGAPTIDSITDRAVPTGLPCRRIGRDAATQGAHLIDPSACHHRPDARADPRRERRSRVHDKIAGWHRAGADHPLAGRRRGPVRGPVRGAECGAREQCGLNRSHVLRASERRTIGIEAATPSFDLTPLERFEPTLERGTPIRIEGGAVVQRLHQRPDVESSAADNERFPPLRPRDVNPRDDIGRPARGGRIRARGRSGR